MLSLAKPGGKILLRHMEDEGANGNYNGLHQWNFTEENGRAVVWNPDSRHFIDEALENARIEVIRERGVQNPHGDWANDWIEVIITKQTTSSHGS